VAEQLADTREEIPLAAEAEAQAVYLGISVQTFRQLYLASDSQRALYTARLRQERALDLLATELDDQ
jgi:hypothetical protein